MRPNLRALALAVTLPFLASTVSLSGNAAAATLTIAQPYDPADLFGTLSTNNPSFAILEPLFFNNPLSGKIEPLLAESFEKVSETEILIKLRKGVSFTNGEPMNADAVVHSLRVFMDPKIASAYTVYSTGLAGAEKVDDHTVRLRLKHPYPALELMLAQVLVTPPAYWAEVGPKGFGQKPIGTGLFKLTEWVKDDRLVMDKNTGYWGKLPEGIDRLVWKAVPDDTARAAGLTTGEYGLAVNLPVTTAIELERRPDLKLIGVDSYRVFQVVQSSLETHPGPIQDKRVRQALNYAIDKKLIIDNLFFGKGGMLHGQILRKNQLGFDPAIDDYPYDPAKAKALLAEAGFPNGFEVGFKCPSNRYPNDRELCEAIAGMLDKVGVKTKITSLESGEFLRQFIARELAPLGLIGLGVPDDPGFAVAAYRSDYRYSYIKNAELDALIDAGARETDRAKRDAIYKKAMRIMHDEAPIIFLFAGVEFYGTTNKLENFKPSGDQRFYFYNTSLK